MKLWIVSMECAGIAEAGGVKNVTFSLCNEFSKLNTINPTFKLVTEQQFNNYYSMSNGENFCLLLNNSSKLFPINCITNIL